ncbi:hypothetical protein ACOYR1_05380 [Thalassotalea piscium]
MTISEEILIVANQLANEGKKPTVALVKTRLSKPIPLAVLINTLKNWQHQPDNSELSVSQEEPKEIRPKKENIAMQIEEAIAPLYLEIKELKQQMADLKSQLISSK